MIEQNNTGTDEEQHEHLVQQVAATNDYTLIYLKTLIEQELMARQIERALAEL
jgi:hypothetical protein